MTCSCCLEAAKFVSYRPKRFVSLMGEIRFERAYYHCSHCGEGMVPWDRTLRVSPHRLTPAAEEVTTLVGIQESFGKAAEQALPKLAGLRLSESTVQRVTEAAGEKLGEHWQAGKVLGESTPWKWNCDLTGKTCGYVSLDATGILMQGPGGSKVDGRMVYVGMVYNPQPRSRDEESLNKPCDGARYLAGLYTLEELGEQLRQQAVQVGMGQVEQIIALSDGGNGLERFFDVYFPTAVKILDFHHATGHLTELAKLLRAGTAANALLSAWCHTLKHAGGTRLLAVLEKLDRKKMPAQTQEELDKVLNYFRNHVHRMNYPEYLRNGWQIGSGSIESACKMVVNQRLGMGGMRWGEQGSDAVAHLRALYRSDADQWEAFWSLAA
jgi:hypothetical protein